VPAQYVPIALKCSVWRTTVSVTAVQYVIILLAAMPGKMLLGAWKVREFFVTKGVGTLE